MTTEEHKGVNVFSPIWNPLIIGTFAAWNRILLGYSLILKAS